MSDFQWSPNKLGGAISLLMAAAALQAAPNVTVDSLSLSSVNPCPGDTVTLQVVIHNNLTYALNPGDAHLYVKLEQTSTHGNGSCPSSFNQIPERDAWWLVDGATNPAVAQDPYKWSMVNPPWPNNGGYAVPPAIAANSAFTVSFVVQLPPFGSQGAQYNTAYQFHVGSKAYTQGASDADQYSCLSFSTCSPPAGYSKVGKRVDGTADNGQPMLYWIDYEYFNTSQSYVQDVLPPCLTLVSAAPQPFNGAAAAWNAGTRTLTWRVADSNSPANHYVSTGQLYVLVTLSGCAGTLTNAAQYCYACSVSGPWSQAPPVSQQVGKPNVLLTKSQQTLGGLNIPNGTVLPNGSNLQYVLQYTLSGSELRCFDGFDPYTLGTYR
jgi:hypothetical protein